MPSTKKKSKKPVSTVGMSRGRRGMFLRIPPGLYEKLRRMAAARMVSGESGSIQDTVMTLIDQAKEKTS